MHFFQMSHLRVNGLLLQKRIGLDVEGLTEFSWYWGPKAENSLKLEE